MAKRRTYSEEQRQEAVAAYISTGSLKGAAALLGIPRKTINEWKIKSPGPDWWDQISQEILDHDRDRRLSRFAAIVDGGTAEILDRIKNGDEKIDPKTGEAYRVKCTLRDLTIATGTALDKHRLLTGQPTSISGKAMTGESILEAMKQAVTKPIGSVHPIDTVSELGTDGQSVDGAVGQDISRPSPLKQISH